MFLLSQKLNKIIFKVGVILKSISEDSLAMLLLNSNLVSFNSKNLEFKPFNLSEWNSLAFKIIESSYNSPSDLFNKSMQQLINNLHIDEQTANKIISLLGNLKELNEKLDYLNNSGINILTRSDNDYPVQFKQRLKELAPPCLFYSGDIKNLQRTAVGVVGSREIDNEGITFTQNLVEQVVKENLAVVSGGARGVDITAQNRAIELNGTAISILHSDLYKWVKKKEIAKSIDSGNLTLITAVHPNARFYASNAMGRNKYIYSQSKVTFVVASSTKGGTWEGAIENIDKKWVPIFVRKDGNEPLGNKMLIEKYYSNPFVHSYTYSSNKSIVEEIRSVLKNIDSQMETNFDVYPLIKNKLDILISKGKTNIQISKELNVNIEQANYWIERYNQEQPIQEKLF